MSTVITDHHRAAVLALTEEQAARIWARCQLRNKNFPRWESDPFENAPKKPSPHQLLEAAIASGNGQRELVLAIMRDNDATSNSAAETLIGKPITRPQPKQPSQARLKNQKDPVPKKLSFDPTHIVRVIVPANPKRQGGDPHRRFALYQPGMTAAEAIAAGVLPADIVWDLDHHFIQLISPEA